MASLGFVAARIQKSADSSGPRREEDLRPRRERSALDAPVDNFVNAQHLERTRAFREVAGDEFKVGHDIANDRARQQSCEQIGLLEARQIAWPKFIMSFCQAFAM